MFQISPTALKQAGFGFNHYDILIPAGTPFSALLIPEFWINGAGRLRRYDTVRAVAEDGTFDAELRVVNDPTQRPGGSPRAEMRVLRYWEPSHDADAEAVRAEVETDLGLADQFAVSFAPAHRWRIVDPAGQVIEKDFATKAEAEARLSALKAERFGIAA